MELLLIIGSLSQMVHVYQVPKVTSSEGSTVTLHCNYTVADMTNFGWFMWYRHAVGGPVVSNDSKDFIGRVSVTTRADFINKRSANIQLHKVNITDNGMYICEISLLFNQTEKGHGNGTYLNVTGHTEGNILTSKILPMVLSVGGGILITSILVAVFFIYWKYASNCHEVLSLPAQQNSENVLYTQNNKNDIYAEPRNKKKPQIHQEYHDLSLYSEIPLSTFK